MTTRLEMPSNRAKVVRIWSEESDNMHSSWTDSLWLTHCKDGTFSLSPRKDIDGNQRRRQCATIDNLRTPEQFVKSVLAVWDELGFAYGHGEVMDVLPAVATLDPAFSASIEHFLRQVHK